MFGDKSDEVQRLKARVAELEADNAELHQQVMAKDLKVFGLQDKLRQFEAHMPVLQAIDTIATWVQLQMKQEG